MTITNSSIIKKLVLIFLVVSGLYFAKELLMPLFVAAVIATFFLPLCKWLESKKIARIVATLISLLGIVLLIVILGTLIGYQISAIADDIDLIKQRVLETIATIHNYIVVTYGISLERQSQLLNSQNATYTWMIPIITGSIVSNLTNLLLTLVYIFCLLYYRSHIKKFILLLTPSSQRDLLGKIINRVARVSQQYLFGLSKMIVLLWILYGISFSIIGVENALFFAILCGTLEIVPFIGNITGSTITIMVAAAKGADVSTLIGIACIYLVIQLFQGWVLEPLIVGSQVKINPLFTIIGLVIGELIWGIPGIFLALPLIAMCKIVCDHIDSLKPYGFLIGEIETKKNDSPIIEKIKTTLKKTL